MKKQKGVTIVGVLVGITILSVALAAQIRLLGNTIRREADLRNMIIATNLAREGIEIAFSWRISEGWTKLKQLRETDLCSDIRMARKSSGCLTSYLNPVAYRDSSIPTSDFTAFLYENSDQTFNTVPFWRTIRIENCGEADEDPTGDICLVLVSRVGWDKDKEVKITKKIYNWYVP